MNYWPLSLIARSPLCQHPGFLHELSQLYDTGYLSPAAFETCACVARATVPFNSQNLVVLDTIDAPPRYVYVGRPGPEEWMKLERGCVLHIPDGTLAVMFEALH